MATFRLGKLYILQMWGKEIMRYSSRGFVMMNVCQRMKLQTHNTRSCIQKSHTHNSHMHNSYTLIQDIDTCTNTHIHKLYTHSSYNHKSYTQTSDPWDSTHTNLCDSVVTLLLLVDLLHFLSDSLQQTNKTHSYYPGI